MASELQAARADVLAVGLLPVTSLVFAKWPLTLISNMYEENRKSIFVESSFFKILLVEDEGVSDAKQSAGWLYCEVGTMNVFNRGVNAQ